MTIHQVNNLTEPAEIELYDYPWQAPLTPVEEACFASRFSSINEEPEDLTILERQMFEASPSDHKWRQNFFTNTPDYLAKYFAKRYVSLINQGDRKAANTFLREKMEPAQKRVELVMKSYQSLPTTHKVTLLSKEHCDEDPFQPVFFTEHGLPEKFTKKQMAFDFEKAEKNHKPVKNRILAELELDELKEMAFTITKIIDSYWGMTAESNAFDSEGKSEREIEHLTNKVIVIAYEQVAIFVRDHFGIKPPRKYKKQTPNSAASDISRMIDEKWWYDRLVRSRKIMREHLAIAMGQVSNKASPYSSWNCVREHQTQQKANYNYIKQNVLIDNESGEEFDLWDIFKKSNANPAIRRHELMVRCRGCEDIGNELGLQGLFLTLTTPSSYHNHYKRGGFVAHWNGASPRDAQSYLNNVWQRIRSKLGREGIRWFGVRVAEPHHDGTPHWHLLIWVKPEEVSQVRHIFIDYATKADREELHPSFDRKEKRAAKKENIRGPMNYKPRCDFGYIDPEKGTATGYIAKYISKNIDGFAMDDLVSDETGKSVKDMAKNVGAWKSRWAIRQFQFFGGAPVTTYRELRRFANHDRTSFQNYLSQLNREELIAIYEEMEVKVSRKFVGPAIPVELLRVNPRFDSFYVKLLLGEAYQPDIEHPITTVSDVMKAADTGNWHCYIMGQGGPFVKREELLITNSYEVMPFASPHGEAVRKLDGFDVTGKFFKTRIKTYTIAAKAKPEMQKQVEYEFDKPSENPSTWKFKKRTVSFVEVTKADASAKGSEATAIGSSAASRSSVNNCTEPERGSKQVRELSPDIEYEIKRLIEEYDLSESFRSDLIRGRVIQLSKEKSIKLRFGATERQPDHLVYQHKQQIDLSWLNEDKPEEVILSDDDEDYVQPNLSCFGMHRPASKSWADYADLVEEEWPLA